MSDLCFTKNNEFASLVNKIFEGSKHKIFVTTIFDTLFRIVLNGKLNFVEERLPSSKIA